MHSLTLHRITNLSIKTKDYFDDDDTREFQVIDIIATDEKGNEFQISCFSTVDLEVAQ